MGDFMVLNGCKGENADPYALRIRTLLTVLLGEKFLQAKEFFLIAFFLPAHLFPLPAHFLPLPKVFLFLPKVLLPQRLNRGIYE